MLKSMKTTSTLSYLALLVFVSLALVGCGTTTTVSLTGTPGTQVSGHYRANHVSSDFAGTAAWQMSFDRQHLEDFEFRKATLGHSVDLDIRRGGRLLVHATAEPGTLGLRVRKESGWRVETLK
jgi:hypothetical protein